MEFLTPIEFFIQLLLLGVSAGSVFGATVYLAYWALGRLIDY